ncbi:MAG: lipid A biosynthesis acyltransferase [Synergistaceae bacterium]|jgi:KDO2-lipid IV(A) lauroyltransferase|nr:lipid A biosynthesis acyltransferase [Synergistaceae bacterium]
MLRGTARLFEALPPRFSRGLGAILGGAAWLASKRKVDRAEARCVSALGVGVTVARAVVRSSFENMGRSVAEFARLGRDKDRLASIVSIEGADRIDEAFSRGRGVIIMSAHMGSWEIAAARLAMGYPLTALYTSQRNGNGLEDVITSIRQAGESTMEFIPSEGWGAMRGIFRALRQGKAVIFMQDLDARGDGVVLPFLGMPASCALGVVKVHLATGAPVLPAVALRNPDMASHTIHVEPILSDSPDQNGKPFGSNIENSLAMCNNVLEAWILRHPDQWMWLLDKWESTAGVVVDTEGSETPRGVVDARGVGNTGGISSITHAGGAITI